MRVGKENDMTNLIKKIPINLIELRESIFP
jgi:hypothetical protein